METIHELNSQPSVVLGSPGHGSSEAVRLHMDIKPATPTPTPRPRHQQAMISITSMPLFQEPTMPSRSLTSPSIKKPVTRSSSQRVREWVKRSNSSREAPRTAKTPQPSPPRSQPLEIVHLGGYRVGESETEPTTITDLLSSTRRPVASRANSTDSRITQWPGNELFSEHQERIALRDENTLNTDTKQTPSLTQINRDETPRPAPLRVPSTSSKELPSPKQSGPGTLTRKNSKWKPLPGLPAQQRPSTAPESRITTTTTPTSSSKHKPPPLPLPYGLGTPPPTPDSSTGNAAAQAPATDAKPNNRKEEENIITVGIIQKDPRSSSGSGSEAAAAAAGVWRGRHTREERMWLHANYRGEAPFLLAWGLNIDRREDREEGMVILRDLMMAQAGGEGGGLGSSSS
ncbi:hypothetical protein B0T19DRAFT_194904 [Cercophora scortea]|uniref:Uncharacterized protein n=1 Tax=Cercophora scortea TaxID=314031 RepID=A0AAE0INT3_9PEZI|nr:hypothetical protein B0T19DRAFT_194904 [Cercophora scortea]